MKVVFVGDTQVGKTCIITRLVTGSFRENNLATIGAAFQTHVISTDQGAVSMQIWDTAGQEKYRALAPMYYRSADVAVLCFDLTNMASFQAMDQWANELEEKAPPNLQLVIVGNKSDLAGERVVAREVAENYAKQHGAVFYKEVSAKTGDGVTELFVGAAKLAVKAENAIFAKETELQADQPARKKGCC